MKRICWGGRSPSGWSGRNVGQGASQLSAQSMLRLKKQSSQLTFLTDTPRLPFTTPSQNVKEKTGSDRRRATAEAANRTLLVSFSQTGAKRPRFALLARAAR